MWEGLEGGVDPFSELGQGGGNNLIDRGIRDALITERESEGESEGERRGQLSNYLIYHHLEGNQMRSNQYRGARRPGLDLIGNEHISHGDLPNSNHIGVDYVEAEKKSLLFGDVL